jgi:hypothetical protein
LKKKRDFWLDKWGRRPKSEPEEAVKPLLALQTNVLVKPDRPADVILIVDTQLITKEVIPLLVKTLEPFLKKKRDFWLDKWGRRPKSEPEEAVKPLT